MDNLTAYNIILEHMNSMDEKELIAHITDCSQKYGIAFLIALNVLIEYDFLKCPEGIKDTIFHGGYAAESLMLSQYFKDFNIEV